MRRRRERRHMWFTLCLYTRWCVRQISIFPADESYKNKLETAVQGSLACLAHRECFQAHTCIYTHVYAIHVHVCTSHT